MKRDETPLEAGQDSGRSEATAGEPPAEEGNVAKRPTYYPLWENAITVAGIYLAIGAVILLLTFGLFSLVSPAKNPYVDIIGYLIVPTILALGVALMPVGILIKSLRLHRRDPSFKVAIRFPRFDLGDPQQRKVVKTVVAGGLLLLPIVGVSSYHGYHFTDSTEFCAYTCHAVMQPEATTYHVSSHARVSCAECHIGSGASWFVKSKLSGVRQVLAVIRDSYHRPIPPAIEHLRPARETCEQCHWPKKFFGAQLRSVTYFASDEENSRHDVRMLVNTGGADTTTGRKEGIHSHMLLQGKIEYIATDEKLQDIPWVRWVDDLGEEKIYRSDGVPCDAPPPDGQRRDTDCMDCHNRPAHKFLSPNKAVDHFLEAGRIDTTLPFIKRQAVSVLTKEYPDAETARLQIVNGIIEFYRRTYPDRYARDTASVRGAADAVAQIYRENFFPYMNVDWRTYPDNVGHFESPGCFRCHDGKHVNQYGVSISHECDVCHTFLNPVDDPSGRVLLAEGKFNHPVELVGVHATLRCDRCHTGVASPAPTCAGCHSDVESLYAASADAFRRFAVEPSVMHGTVDCDGCHNLSTPLSLETMNSACLDCHDEDHDGLLKEWADTVTGQMAGARSAMAGLEESVVGKTSKEAGAARKWLAENRPVLTAIEKANPLHNPEAAGTILETLTDEATGLADGLQQPVADQAPATRP